MVDNFYENPKTQVRWLTEIKQDLAETKLTKEDTLHKVIFRKKVKNLGISGNNVREKQRQLRQMKGKRDIMKRLKNIGRLKNRGHMRKENEQNHKEFLSTGT